MTPDVIERGPHAGHPTRSSAVLRGSAILVAVLSAGLLVSGTVGSVSLDGEVSPLPIELVEELTTFDDELLAEIAAYRAPRRIAAVVALIAGVAVPALLALGLASGRPKGLVRVVERLPGTSLQVGGAIAAVVLLTAAVRLPLNAWAGVIQDGRYGFRTRSVPGWLLDHLLVIGGRALGLGLLAATVVSIVLRHPREWPARVTLLVAVIGPFMLLLHPLVAHPLLLPTGPLPDGDHREAIAEVLARSDREVHVLVGDASRRTTRRNALATGLGPTERVVLHDTLFDLEPREVAAIAAHEIAHLERRDPLRAALAPVPLVALLAFLAERRLRARGRPSMRDLAALGALVLALEVAATPLTAGLTRAVEHRTDVRSVGLSEDPEAHLTLLRTFVVDGLADPEPPGWTVLLWATHPPPMDRMRAVIDVGGPATR